MRSIKALPVALLAMMLVATGVAWGHGYSEEPRSRARWCQVGEVRNCGPVQYEPQSTEGPKGFPAKGPADGKLCSAGQSRFAQVDKPKTPAGAEWPATTLRANTKHDFEWTLTAAHATTAFEYYVTKPGWNKNHALTRADLDRVPFHRETYGGEVPAKTVVHKDVKIPDLVGRHVILAVWVIDDTANAFYSCADVVFE